MNSAIYSKITCFWCCCSTLHQYTVRPSDIRRCAEGRWGTSGICSGVEEKITDVTTKDTASGFNGANVLVKSKIQNDNYQINRLKRLKNTE
jgi:hypothetical protein